MGKPVAPSSTSATTDAAAKAVAKAAADGEATSTAEDVWLDSGYIEYMENQRKEGWKT